MMLIGSGQRYNGNDGNIVGSGSRVRGNRNNVTGSGANVEGDDNNVTGSGAHVKGNNNRIKGFNASVIGDNNTGMGDNAVISGNNNKWVGRNVTIKPGGVGNVVTELNGNEDNGVSVMNFGGMTMTFSNGGMFMDNSKTKKGKKKTKKDKRQREEEEEPKFVQGPPPSDLEHDKPANNDNECLVCLERAKACICWPCRHVCLCVQCARTLCFGEDDAPKKVGQVTCPECRKACEYVLRTY
jgi:hypothetical protein